MSQTESVILFRKIMDEFMDTEELLGRHQKHKTYLNLKQSL